jgi:hypothetical protein
LNSRAGKAYKEKLELENKTLRTEVGNLKRSLKGIIPHKGQKDRHQERTPPRRGDRDRRDNHGDDKEFYEDRKEVSYTDNT